MFMNRNKFTMINWLRRAFVYNYVDHFPLLLLVWSLCNIYRKIGQMLYKSIIYPKKTIQLEEKGVLDKIHAD